MSQVLTWYHAVLYKLNGQDVYQVLQTKQIDIGQPKQNHSQVTEGESIRDEAE